MKYCSVEKQKRKRYRQEEYARNYGKIKISTVKQLLGSRREFI